MKRRSFLKYLSSIPLIGIPVKALAKTPEVKKYGEYVQAGFDNVPLKDPYADVAEHVFKEYWNDSAEMNAAWMKRKS
jgi:hypothetical protein